MLPCEYGELLESCCCDRQVLREKVLVTAVSGFLLKCTVLETDNSHAESSEFDKHSFLLA